MGDTRGWYNDGAYTAAPDDLVEDWDEAEGEEDGDAGMDPQTAYFDGMIARFAMLRQRLNRKPPAKIVDTLDTDHPTYIPRLNNEISRAWRWRFRNIDPHPAQLASMDKSSVLRLLGLLTTGRILRRGEYVDAKVSRWAWGLLARLPERGELVSEEIGIVRELGKRAVLLGTWLKDEKTWEEGLDEVERELEDDTTDGADDSYMNEDGEVKEDFEEGQFGADEDLDESMAEEYEEVDEPAEEDIMGVTLQASTTQKSHAIVDESNATIEISAETAVSQPAASTDDISAAKLALLERLRTNYADSEDSPQTTHLADSEIKPDTSGLPVSTSAPDLLDPQVASRQNTRATIDMILTVAGELYGQRDLLEFREMWEAETEALEA